MVGDFKVITLCGSAKFKEDFLKIQQKLTFEGNIVLSLVFFDSESEDIIFSDTKSVCSTICIKER